MDLLPAGQHEPASAGRPVPDATAPPAGRDAASLPDELDEEGGEVRPGPVATPAYPAADATHDQPEPTPISALGADLEQGPDETPGGTVAERLVMSRAGLTPAVRNAQRTRPAARRAEQGAQGLEGITQPTPGRGLYRPPGHEPEPAAGEARRRGTRHLCRNGAGL